MNQYISFYIFGYIGYAHPKQGGSKVGKKKGLYDTWHLMGDAFGIYKQTKQGW